jgi:2-polyprenyl-3-methyl-5-hydroxy-6-metoxy-1,4-benzoquinol methylase
VVIYDPPRDTYLLPPEHAALLTRAASPENLAVTMQIFPVLGRVEDEIVERFRNGGGVPYSAYHRFHEIMAEESGQTVVATLLDKILPLVPGGLAMLKRGADVLDVGCGRGRALTTMAAAFPNSRFTGYDLCDDAIEAATEDAARRGLNNVTFRALDASEVDEPERYDLITAFDAVHDQRDPARVLENIYEALRPGGVLLMQDIAASRHLEKNIEHPLGTLLYAISCMHCMSVSLAQCGAGLGTCWGRETAEDMLADVGFTNVRFHTLEHDVQNFFAVATKDR